jgi:hypothetical protein
VIDEGSPDDEPSPPRRWPWAVAAAAALALFIGVLLARSGGPIHADTTEHVRLTSVMGPLSENTPLRQRFTARADELSAITMRFGTGGGVTRCDVAVRVTSGGQEISSRVIPCGSMADSVPLEVARFDPQPDSKGREYEIETSLARAGGDSVVVWGGLDADGLLPAAQFGDTQLDASFELHTDYGGGHRAWDQVTLALDRLSQYRPWFQQPAAVVLFALAALGLIVALVIVRGRWAVALLVLLAVSKGLVWSAIIPPLEAPDEPAHVAYSQFMAETHRIPKRNVAQLGLPPGQFYSPQLTRLIDALHQTSQAPGDRPDFRPDGDPSAVHDAGEQSPDANGDGAAAGYPPVYYFPAAVLYALSSGPLVHQIEVMRWWSIALGAVAGVLTLYIGRRLFPRSEGAAIALAVACVLEPELSQQTAVVNNDALAIAGGAACLLVALDLIRPAKSRSRWLCALGGVALGITAFKSFGIIFAPVLLVAWFLGRWRTARADRPSLLVEIAQAAGGVAVTYGAWALFAAVFGFQGASLSDLTPSDQPKTLHAYIHALQKDWYRPIRLNWIDQLWGDFSWIDTPFPTWVQTTLLILSLAAVAVVLVWIGYVLTQAVRGRLRAVPRDVIERWAQTLVCVLSVVATFVFFIGLGYLNFHKTGRNDLIQGRYALMLLPAMLAAPTLALWSLWPRLKPVVPMATAAAAMTALNIGAVMLVVERFYL